MKLGGSCSGFWHLAGTHLPVNCLSKVVSLIRDLTSALRFISNQELVPSLIVYETNQTYRIAPKIDSARSILLALARNAPCIWHRASLGMAAHIATIHPPPAYARSSCPG